jgi:hypothetical protein
MRYFLFFIFLCFTSSIAARTLPDSLEVSKLFGTSWNLVTKYKPSGLFHRLKKVRKEESQQRITIYSNEIHISVSNGPYQICASRLRFQNEFWIDGKQADQLIYRVIRIEGSKLVIDVLTKPKGQTVYQRTSRNYYVRALD